MMFFHKDWSKESSKFLQQTEEELLHETCRNLLTQIGLGLQELMKNRYLSELLCGMMLFTLTGKGNADRSDEKQIPIEVIMWYDAFHTDWQMKRRQK